MAPSGMQGWFDGFDGNTVYGWAVRCRRLGLVGTVDVFVDGTLAATLAAGQFRGDLKGEGIRDGYAAFSYEIPEVYRDGKPHTVDVRHHGTDTSLIRSPQVYTSAMPSVSGELRREGWTLSHLILKDGTHNDDFADKFGTQRKVAIVSTYHDAGRFLSYHETLFRTLAENGFVTVVVHASGNASGTVAAPRAENCYVIVKHNVGYDFGSWAVALHRLQPYLEQIDELLLLNDSVIPIDTAAIGALIRRARHSGSEVVGLTDSYEHTYHLQSYFIWLSAAALRAEAFRDFMAAYSFSSIKKTVIKEGELALTKCFLDAGLSVQALFEYDEVSAHWFRNLGDLMAEIDDLPAPTSALPGEDYRRALHKQLGIMAGNLVDGRPMNPTHFFWDTLIERFGFPFVKRELAMVNPSSVPTYFRIGQVLHARAQARSEIKEIRRIYGGSLLPMFVPRPVASAVFPSLVALSSEQAACLAAVG